jgi:glutathione S-transferase
MSKPELISFKICPYVQRAVILLNEKKTPFEVTYIDLKDKPDWFLRLSPMGKVPILKVGETVLFESAVIAEYLDEVHPPPLHPTDPLQKALNRAWIEFSSELFMDLYRMTLAETSDAFEEKRNAVRQKLERLEEQLKDGPFFNGADFSLLDASIAPAFMRLALVEEIRPMRLLDSLPKVQRWSESLLARESVRDSVVPEFADLFREYIEKGGGYLAEARGQ